MRDNRRNRDESEGNILHGVKIILKDFEREGLIRIEGNRVELTEEGKKVYENLLKRLAQHFLM